MSLYVLFENASGYALFEQTESDEIGQLLEEMQDSMADLNRQVFLPQLMACGDLDRILMHYAPTSS